MAPTGIAAINAGGVTIHSMFGLPLTTFLPTYDQVDGNLSISIPMLMPHFKYRGDKLKLLRALEILIIDEVSMLRCDVLDMMDLALQSARRVRKKFGGLQILFIGDLYQLPPVVKSETEQILYSYYNSPFFFEAKSIEQLNLITVSLNKVYRQKDEKFLSLLNAIRNNDIDNVDFELLHTRYQPYFEPEEFFVHLVSHNYMADGINKKHLDELHGKSHIYKAEITGDFKPHLFPNSEALELKKDAQVMFIRNDVNEEKRFYNGMLATVTELGEEFIKVQPQDTSHSILIEREVWENKRYRIDAENKVGEDIIGSYEQFPLKLAWAVTIHKSQGLTFDKVIIDAGKSFTSGQVYVALSRCRTLEGIVLKSMIPAQAIIVDNRIRHFQQDTEIGDRITNILETEKYDFAVSRLLLKLDLSNLLDAMLTWEEAVKTSTGIKNKDTEFIMERVLRELQNLSQVYYKFQEFADNKVKLFNQTKTGWEILETKSSGAVDFFFKNINTKVLDCLKECLKETKGVKGLKGYNNVLKNFVELTASYLNNLRIATLLDVKLFTEKEEAKVTAEVTKKPSHLVSFQLFEDGKTIFEIAEEREMAVSTILGHLAKMADVGVLDIHKLFTAEKIRIFKEQFTQHDFPGLTQWKTVLPEDFDFNEIRVLLNHFNYQKAKIAKS